MAMAHSTLTSSDLLDLPVAFRGLVVGVGGDHSVRGSFSVVDLRHLGANIHLHA